jgi:hypothetical protein
VGAVVGSIDLGMLSVAEGPNMSGTTLTAAPVFTVTLSDFSLQMEYVDIGMSALKLLDETLVDGKAFNQGVTYRTSSVSLPSTAGSQTLLAGIRGSSVKSLFARFYDTNSLTSLSGSCNGKYDSKNPSINSINFNIGGVKYPPAPVNPLLHPSQAFSDLQKAIGNFNSATFRSSITPLRYCVLSAGGTTTVPATTANTQAWEWNASTNSVASSTCKQQASFLFGQNLEICARRGLLTGVNATTAPIFLELNIATAPTSAHNVYVIGMLDCIYIHDVRTGSITCRL